MFANLLVISSFHTFVAIPEFCIAANSESTFRNTRKATVKEYAEAELKRHEATMKKLQAEFRVLEVNALDALRKYEEQKAELEKAQQQQPVPSKK